MLIRDQNGAFIPLGRHHKGWREDLVDTSSIPAWLRPARNSSDVELTGGSLAWTPADGAEPGRATISYTAGAAGVYGIEGVKAIDLASGMFRRVAFTLRNLQFTEIGNVAWTVEFGIRGRTDSGATAAGARLITSGSSGAWPVINSFASSGPSANEQARLPLAGARGLSGAGGGSGSRDLTFMLDVPDKTVSLLMGDQVLYSRKHPSMVLGPVRPRFVIGIPSGAPTTNRVAKCTGISFEWETNG